MRRWTVIPGILMMPLFTAGSSPALQTGDLSAEQWREDLSVMAGLLTRLHASPFHTTTRTAFDMAVQRLHAAIPSLAEQDIVVRMARLAASIGDGHTRLNLSSWTPRASAARGVGLDRLPLRLEWYAEGPFVRPASAELAPNQYGELEPVALPNSGITVSYASWYFQTSDPWDRRPWVPPSVFVPLTRSDAASGRDRALEAALAHDVRAPSLASTLVRTAREQGVDSALAVYRRHRADPAHRYTDTERALTALVIDFWRRDDVPASRPVAELVVEEYPTSFEAHENLAEIHAHQGNAALAVRHALESLRLHPGNGDALGVLREVCGDGVLRAFITRMPGTSEGAEALRRACRATASR